MIKHVITNHLNYEIESFKEYENNILIKEEYYNDKGQFHGTITEYRKNGQRWVETKYKNGKLYGNYRIWQPNGKLAFQCNFKNNQRHGLCITYKENGELENQSTYENGIITKIKIKKYK